MMAPTFATAPRTSLADLRALARAGLLRASAEAAAEGIPGTDAGGQLIRPLVALAAVADPTAPPPGFREGVLAIQLAHEASLIHDDIVDAAAERRGRATLVASGGVPRALLRGDHLLTAAYRAAARTGSLAFATLFARSVERTVAAEGAQGSDAGQVLDHARYEAIALGKAGELLGCALALAPLLEDRPGAAEHFELGSRVGLLYQMLDDLLDYCPSAATGKPPLGDYAQRRWTWVLEECAGLEFGMERSDVLQHVHGRVAGESAMERCARRLESEGAELRAEIAERLPAGAHLAELIESWVASGVEAVRAEAAAAARSSAALVLRRRVPALEGSTGYLAEHSRSFRFASRFFPAAEGARVARVYAFCRVTDDLVDRPSDGSEGEALLEAWLELARGAYLGTPSGLPLLDRVMAEMAGAYVPFEHAADLVEGMRMDLRGERYATLADLRRYTYRVASVVGLWLTRLFGVHDRAVLERAERMGHAMQLTNVLRDVGEDWSRGRLYLPADVMQRHGVSEADLQRMWLGAPITSGYREMSEELLRAAEADYAAAFAALPALPATLARPVAVAAHVYRGIHAEIRRNGYDNLRLRAHTSRMGKGMLAVRALWELHRAPPARVTARAAAVAGAPGHE